MPDLISTFRDKAEGLLETLDRKGGVRSMIDSLRRQMAESDRRRTIHQAKAELQRLGGQINEMITAVGVQAVGLHQVGRLTSPELQPLCQHIVELKAALTQQEAELSKLEAEASAASAAAASAARACVSCGKPLPAEGTFCPYCGAAMPPPQAAAARFCIHCGTELRPGARFCARCGQAVTP